MIHSHCARCKRPIRTPIVVDGKGYGPTCAAKVGDLLTQPAERVRNGTGRARRGDARQMQLEVTR